MNVIPSQFDMLRQAVDAANLRHTVISQNIANVNTPGYQRLGVRFEDFLSKEIQEGREPDMDTIQAEIYRDKSRPVRKDGNNVDISVEAGQLRKNTVLFNSYVRILTSRLRMMRAAISGGYDQA